MQLLNFAMPICKVKQLGSGVVQAFVHSVNNYNSPGLYISYSCYSFAKQISLTVGHGQCLDSISIRLEQGIASAILCSHTSHCHCSYRSTACSLFILYSNLELINNLNSWREWEVVGLWQRALYAEQEVSAANAKRKKFSSTCRMWKGVPVQYQGILRVLSISRVSSGSLGISRVSSKSLGIFDTRVPVSGYLEDIILVLRHSVHLKSQCQGTLRVSS